MAMTEPIDAATEEIDPGGERDPEAVAAFMRVVGPLMRNYFRCEVRGMEHVPAGGALVVGNHSGGILTMDLPVFLTGFVDQFGCERPFYLLSHEQLLIGPTGRAAPLVGPGGSESGERRGAAAHRRGHDGLPWRRVRRVAGRSPSGTRSTSAAARGTCGRRSRPGCRSCRACRSAGHETQLFLGRGEQLIKTLGLNKLFGVRARAIPFSIGFPFGFSAVMPLNLPLPSKIVTSVLEPIDPGTSAQRQGDQGRGQAGAIVDAD